MTQYIISPVKKLVQEAISKNAFMPMDFNYPGFSISKEAHVQLVEELIQRKVNIGVARGDYRATSLLNNGESFNDLVRNEEKSIKNEKLDRITMLLASDLRKDSDLDFKNMQSFSRQSVLNGLMTHVKATLMEVSIIQNSLPDPQNPMEAERKIDALAASMIYVKFNNPIAYKDMQTELENSPFKSVVNDLQKEINNPSLTTLRIIKNIDSKFTQEHFPKAFMENRHNDHIERKVENGQAYSSISDKLAKFRESVKPVEEKKRIFSFR